MAHNKHIKADFSWLPFIACLLIVALTAGCLPTGTEPSPQPTTPVATSTQELSPSPTPAVTQEPSPSPTATPTPGNPNPVVEVVATGLDVPWEVAFAPDGRIFVTERTGNLRVMVDGQLLPDPVATLPVSASGEGGLMGLALDPSFAENHYLYIMYTYQDSQGALKNRVARLTENNNKAGEEQIILDGIAGAGIHDGGRIKFGPDGKLWVTTGDAANTQLSQQLDSLNGKILRINSDGSIPGDNPFPGSAVYTYGHRNVQGIAWRPNSQWVLASEHGPSGHDEVNVIQPGQNYGWPMVAGAGQQQGLSDPILDVSPSIAPSGIAFLEGSGGPWNGNLFVATLRGNLLLRLVLSPDLAQSPTIVQQERLFEGQYGRLRTVVLGPDGNLYVTTNNRDGRGTPQQGDDKILRIIPPAS